MSKGLISRMRDFFASHKYSIGGWLTQIFAAEDAGDLSTEGVRSIPALFRAAQIVAETIAGLELAEYSIDDDGNAIKQPASRTARTLTLDPNPYQTAYTFWESLVLNLIFEGNGLAVMTRNGYGDVVRVDLASMYDLKNVTLDGANMYYDFGEKFGRVHSSNVIHVAGPSMDGVFGDALYQRFRDVFETQRAAMRYLRNFYKSGAIIKGVIETDKMLGDIGMRSLQKSFDKYHAGSDSPFKTPVLEAGAKYRPTSANVMEAGVAEVKKLMAEEIANIIGVPLHMISQMEGTSYNSIEHLSIHFQKFTIQPYTRRIQAELQRKLGRPAKQWRFDLTGLLLGDMKTMGEWLQRMFNISVLSPDEIRQRLGLGKVEHGDQYFIQGNNMVPVSFMEEILANKIAPKPAADPIKEIDSPSITEE